MAVGASRLAMVGQAASGIMILTTAATVASMYYSQKHTEAIQYLADVKIWEAKTLAACELMKRVVRRSDEIATLTTRLTEKGFEITYIDKEGGERKLTLTEDFAW